MSLKKYISNNFSYDVSGLTAYTDETRQDLIVRSVTEAQTLKYIAIQQGIKGSEALNLMNDSIVYQAGDCTMTNSGYGFYAKRYRG